MAADRIYVLGGPGSGKTTFAQRIAAARNLPVHHLDEVARVGGGHGPERSAAERETDVDAIVASDRWVAEGVHLGWTRPLLDAADVVVWLDHVAWRGSSRRIVSRFIKGAAAEARRRRGRDRFLRVGDYARRLRELAVSIPETRRYHRSATAEAAEGESTVSRAATARALQGFESKLIHCRTPADVEAALKEVTG
jgi:adenylate kinase family enzyme